MALIILHIATETGTVGALTADFRRHDALVSSNGKAPIQEVKALEDAFTAALPTLFNVFCSSSFQQKNGRTADEALGEISSVKWYSSISGTSRWKRAHWQKLMDVFHSSPMSITTMEFSSQSYSVHPSNEPLQQNTAQNGRMQ
jgi:hypothetical protein